MTESVRMAQWPAGDPEGEATHKIHCLCEFDVVRLRQEVTEYSQHAAEAIGEVERWKLESESHENVKESLRAEIARLQALVEAHLSMVAEMRGDLEADFARQSWPRITVLRWLRWTERPALDQATTPASGVGDHQPESKS